MTSIKEILDLMKIEGEVNLKILENMINHYEKMRFEYVNNDYEALGLHGGKFCENAANLILSLLGETPEKNPQLGKILDKIEKIQSQTNDINPMIKITIPRMLRAAYELRSKRNTVHVSDEIDPNRMDGTNLVNLCSWVFAELIRNYYTGDMSKASEIIERITKIDFPFMDEFKGKKIIVAKNLSVAQKALLHLADTRIETPVDEIVEYIPNADRNHILTSLRQLRDNNLIHYDGELAKITVPLGIKEVEKIIKDKNLM